MNSDILKIVLVKPEKYIYSLGRELSVIFQRIVAPKQCAGQFKKKQNKTN